ncbi:unnamed protein product [Paramecium sonneborni]|uniref:Transmembrane protein n=1 Tax=Paramecium sonneborni TaxID=65129 RepID=A0A8S1PET6_9CILI|nr:unnamed protein product [Paramecium sonneborni]
MNLGELRTVNQSLNIYQEVYIIGLQIVLICNINNNIIGGGLFMYVSMLNAKRKHQKQTGVDQKQNIKQRSNSAKQKENEVAHTSQIGYH